MLKMGLIGLGKMGKYHLNLYDSFSELKLAGICDVDSDSVNFLAQKYNVPGFTDFRELLPLVDAVTIAAPTKYHYGIAFACLNAGKHLLVEKPITTNYDEAVHLFQLAEQKNLVLHIGHVERFNGAVQELKNIVNEPLLIEARRVGPFNPNFKADSIVLDLMIHDIDIALNVAGKPVEAVQAMGARVHTDMADYASVNIYFGGSTTAHILSSRINQNKERFLHVTQPDALIELDYTTQDITVTRQGRTQHIFGDKELKYKNEFIQERIAVYKDNPLKQEIKHFVEGIMMKTPRTVSIEHDLRSLKVALDIDELLKKGKQGCEEVKQEVP